jgi:hypothetical protein
MVQFPRPGLPYLSTSRPHNYSLLSTVVGRLVWQRLRRSLNQAATVVTDRNKVQPPQGSTDVLDDLLPHLAGRGWLL